MFSHATTEKNVYIITICLDLGIILGIFWKREETRNSRNFRDYLFVFLDKVGEQALDEKNVKFCV
jgi:hypothetical protein